MQVHYNTTFYNSTTLMKAARIYLSHLPKRITMLVSSGNSGCAIASAMLTLSKRKLHHVCVRKTDHDIQVSHSGMSGYSYDMLKREHKIAIVDDFVAGGNTIERIIKSLADSSKRVDVILINNFESGERTFDRGKIGGNPSKIPIILCQGVAKKRSKR